MKSLVHAVLVAILFGTQLAGCAAVKPQSAMEWLQSERMVIDDP